MKNKTLIKHDRELVIYEDGRIYQNPYTSINSKNQAKTKIRGRWMKTFDNGAGYPRVSISVQSKQKRFYVHRLIAEAFIPNPKNRKEINHINGNTFDYSIPNLEWCTHSENMLDMIKKRKPSYSTEVPILQFKTNGMFVMEFRSIIEAAKSVNCTNTNISTALKGVSNQAMGFIWMRKDKYDPSVHTAENIISSHKNKNQRSVKMISEEIEKTFNSVDEAAKYIVDLTGRNYATVNTRISNVARGYKGRKTGYGYSWKYI